MTHDDERQARLAAALRANLRRRKAAKEASTEVRASGETVAFALAAPPREGENKVVADDPDA